MRPVAIVLLVLVACTGAGDSASTPPATRAPPAPTRPAAPPVPSFARDVEPFLAHTCAAARDCHGEHPSDVELDLRVGASYRALVGAESKARPGALLVVPGDPRASFLLDKLAGTLGPHEGKRMPCDPDTGEPSALEPPDFVARVLVPWIAAGAPGREPGTGAADTPAAPPPATLAPATPGEPLDGRLESAHATAVLWTPRGGPTVRFTLNGDSQGRLAASYPGTGAYAGQPLSGFWPDSCGPTGTIRWSVADGGKLRLRCSVDDVPQNEHEVTFRWNASEGTVDLDDVRFFENGRPVP